MTVRGALLGILVGALTAECCGVSEWAARRLTSWAVRLSYGQTPRAQTRLVEQAGNLGNCPGQITKLLYALGLAAQGVFDWLGRATGRRAALTGEGITGYFGRAATEALSLALAGVDLRGTSQGRRREIGRLSARLAELLRHPAEAFDHDSMTVLLATAASMCDAYIDDRNECAAQSLAEAAGPHIELLGRSHPAAMGVRRAYAHALLQRGHGQEAEVLLCELSGDEAQIFGADDPRTFRTRQLLLWALVQTGRPEEATAGFRALETLMAAWPDADALLLRHVQCKQCWALGEQGLVPEAAAGYDRVIANRSRELSADHPDTLDARHSLGKMFVLEAGDGARALTVLLPLLADRRRVEGNHHPDTLETRKYVAVARALSRPHDAGAHRKALRELRRIRRLQARRPGPGHPYTRDTERWLATLTRSSEGQ